MAAFYPRCDVVLEILLEDFADGDGETVLDIVTVPRSATWIRDHQRSADTFELELDYRDLPIDPRLARAIRVSILCADVGAPDARLDPDNDNHRAFLGFVDQPETLLDDSGERVRLEGRDYTALFLDTTWTGEPIDITRPLSVVIDAIVDTVAGTTDMRIAYSPGASDLVLADVLGKTVWTPQPEDDVWTVLVDLCAKVGLLPAVRLDRIEIRSPDDFGEREVHFRYGTDVERLSFRRKFNEATTRQVRVIAFDPAARTVSEAVYPAEPIVTRKRISTAGKVTTETAPEVRFPIEGSYTQARLDEIARGFYEEAARQEVEGNIVTRELVDISGEPVPLLANGDQVGIRLGANLPNLAGMSRGEAIALLTGARWGLEAAVAAALVDAWLRAERLAALFYVSEARHNWAIDSGYSAEIGFRNFIASGRR